MAIHIIRMDLDLPQFDEPTLRQTGGPEDPELSQRFSEWVSAFRTLRKREPSLEEMSQWIHQQGVQDGKNLQND